ncbi:MAG: hypothetical protein ACKVUS_15010 [Saprospiraceae bacterium]
MQKRFSLLALSVLLLQLPESSQLSGSSLPHIFRDDLSKLDCEMAPLAELEQWVQTTSATHSQLLKEGNPLAQHAVQEGDIAGPLFGSSAPGHERLLDIPGFLWGLCCSVVGMFLVYLAIEDPEARKKEGTQAIFGCAVSTGLLVGLYVWLIAWLQYY